MVYNMRVDGFSALGDPTRRKILEMLAARGELSAGEIYAKFPISHPAISQHLKVLRQAGLVEVEKRAQQRLYRINPEALAEMEGWLQQTTKLWTERFERLDAVLEREKRRQKTKEEEKNEKT